MRDLLLCIYSCLVLWQQMILLKFHYDSIVVFRKDNIALLSVFRLSSPTKVVTELTYILLTGAQIALMLCGKSVMQ